MPAVSNKVASNSGSLKEQSKATEAVYRRSVVRASLVKKFILEGTIGCMAMASSNRVWIATAGDIKVWTKVGSVNAA